MKRSARLSRWLPNRPIISLSVLAAFVSLAGCSSELFESNDPAKSHQAARAALEAYPQRPQHQLQNIGFFTPRGIQSDLAGRTAFGMFNLWNMEQVTQGLSVAQNTGYRVYMDLGPAITRPKAGSQLSMTYVDLEGQLITKQFEPLDQPKVLEFLPDEQIESLIGPVFDEIARSPSGIETIFIADEPYINGISRSEMERVALLIRKLLDDRDLKRVKLGVIFSSAMFNPSYAEMVSDAHSEYAQGIDSYYEQAYQGDDSKSRKHADFLKTHRLTTYDKAGNLFTEGGLPSGYDVIGFDFYISTQLLDFVQNKSLQWFAANTQNPACRPFAGRAVSEVRTQLSFFQNGDFDEDDYTAKVAAQDKALLDEMFECRNAGILEHLQLAIADRSNEGGTQRGVAGGNKRASLRAADAKSLEIMLVSESANNGLLEFKADGGIEEDQPEAVIEQRVLDEVNRAIGFYDRNRAQLTGGVMFFTFDSEYDNTIKLKIGGASSMPTVVDEILAYTAGEAQKHAQAPLTQAPLTQAQGGASTLR